MSRRDLLQYARDLGFGDLEVAEPGTARPEAGPAPVEAGTESARTAPGPDPLAATDLAAMAAALADCRRCRLCQARKQVVFGVGNPRARVMLVGEGPGADEDRLGEPFVGKAGQLLNAMLGAIGMTRAEVYIANIVKCRPPENRNPEDDEAATCMPFLKRQIELVDPDLVVCLGKVAVQQLLGIKAGITSVRGRWVAWEGRQVLLTFHPAYLLRTPTAKAQTWADLRSLSARLGTPRAAATDPAAGPEVQST